MSGSFRSNFSIASIHLRLYETIKSQSRIILLFCRGMFKRFAKYKSNLESAMVDVELEARIQIPKPTNIIFEDETVITYYRSTMYPSLIFRRINNGKLNSKETVEKIKYGEVTICLSIEQTYSNMDIKFPIIPANKRTISRKRICENPIVDITKCGDQYTLEIEFDYSNYMHIEKILKEWKNPYWPPVKPMEISSSNLAKKLANNEQWCISPKADGIHVLVYSDGENQFIVHTNGYTEGDTNIKVNRIFEGELMSNGEILYFDCLMWENKNITKLDYIARYKYLENMNKKEIILFNNIYAIKKYLDKKHDFETDGYIITNIKNRKKVYKSKFKNTVDLRYKNGYLLLENEEFSERSPKNVNEQLEEDKIYEFDMEMNLIRERKDKTIANYKMPYDDNPIYKIAHSIGVPTLRYYHNKIKRELLSMLPKTTLLDIGSAKGGDITKWTNLKFEKVYAVDPNLELRQRSKKVVEIRENIEDVYKMFDYESVSLFFVPWNDKFIDVINKAKYFVLICMDKPVTVKEDCFECKIENEKVILKIPDTQTSEYVEENLIKYSDVFKKLKNWKHMKINRTMNTGSAQEIELSRMYSYHFFSKK